jgi:hypothetical protein
MATAYLAEFPEIVRYQGIASPGLEMPPIASQTVTIVAGSTQSAAFNAKTRLLGISVDAACGIEFGASPTAVATSFRVPANTVTFWRVIPGQKVATIA